LHDILHCRRGEHTLSVEEVINENVVSGIRMRCLLKHLLAVAGWPDAHVLLAESTSMVFDVQVLLCDNDNNNSSVN
jgi:hypothetical protein